MSSNHTDYASWIRDNTINYTSHYKITSTRLPSTLEAGSRAFKARKHPGRATAAASLDLQCIRHAFSFIRQDVKANKGGGGGKEMRIKDVTMEEDQRLWHPPPPPECKSRDATKQLGHCAAGAARAEKCRRSHNDYRRAESAMSPRSDTLVRSRFLRSSGAQRCLCSELKVAHPRTCDRVILTSRLVLVPRRAIWHL